VLLFQNLIGNAVKYRKEGVRPTIEIGAQREQGHWKFHVKDNGIGIDPKYKDQAFMVFKRLHSRDKYGGTGMGLAICKRIVERHGGSIWVESQLGQGSTFFFTIPQEPLPPGAPRPLRQEAPSAHAAPAAARHDDAPSSGDLADHR
jgi:light-regulated signal transduction histidine kinase (bacteriophytochrome)